MTGMTPAETADYITHHLKLAGRTDTLFSDDAITLIHHAARGYPRAVNNLAVQALVAAFAARQAHRRRDSRPRRRHRDHRRLTTLTTHTDDQPSPHRPARHTTDKGPRPETPAGPFTSPHRPKHQ